jgi:hypothetical protein
LAGEALRDRRVGLLIVTAGLWAVGQLVADDVNGLGVRLSMQVITAVSMLAIVPTLVHLGRTDFRRSRWLALGVAGGLILEAVFVEGLSLGDPGTWKFGLNPPVSVAVLAATDLAWRRGRRLPSFLALAAVCGIGIATDARGIAGIAALTALVMVFPRRRHRYPKVFSALSGVVLLVGVLGAFFIESAQSGVLGDRSGNQVEKYGPRRVSIMVNVRPELFQELSLFSQRPLDGFGSRPRLDTLTYDRSLQFIREVGVIRTDVHDNWLHADDPGVPAHSMAADSWARAGVSAVPFWILVIGLAVWAGTTAIRFRSSPLVLFWTMLTLWDTLFSPLPGLGHIELANYLVMAVVTIASRGGRSPRVRPLDTASLAPVR